MDDLIPERFQRFLFELTSIKGHAEINKEKNTIPIVIASSDNPFEKVGFGKDNAITIKEEENRVITIPVFRTFGIEGTVRVSFTTSGGTAVGNAMTIFKMLRDF